MRRRVAGKGRSSSTGTYDAGKGKYGGSVAQAQRFVSASSGGSNKGKDKGKDKEKGSGKKGK